MLELRFSVCVVDDYASIRTSIARLLSERGFLVETFDSAAAYLRRTPCHGSCRLLLDISMPDMDGIELAQALQRAGRRDRIVFMSARDTDAIRCRIDEIGAIELVRKPFVADDLIAALERAQPLPPR